MRSEQPLSRAPTPTPALRRPTPDSGRTSGLYGEVVTMPVSRREMATTAERKAPV